MLPQNEIGSSETASEAFLGPKILREVFALVLTMVTEF